MNRKISDSFEIPPASVHTLSAIGMIISVTVYDKILIPILRRATGNERGIKILQRVGIGMVFPVLSMAVAALVEKKRLRVVERDYTRREKWDSIDECILVSSSVCCCFGIGDGFTLVGLQENFYDHQVPDSKRSLGIAFYLSVIGLGNF
ncbi:major facilitator superfamily protein [Actinidia rufa]|uniref:Major facilitator superfamily protein n=1 Tax=Actinidia rufa TaxID=165716 RepID=A0A7J0DIQ5_9ERIC|nr:major facilitator superfamily protein [Actinidia rufa]